MRTADGERRGCFSWPWRVWVRANRGLFTHSPGQQGCPSGCSTPGGTQWPSEDSSPSVVQPAGTSLNPCLRPSRGCGGLAPLGHLPCHVEKAEHRETCTAAHGGRSEQDRRTQRPRDQTAEPLDPPVPKAAALWGFLVTGRNSFGHAAFLPLPTEEVCAPGGLGVGGTEYAVASVVQPCATSQLCSSGSLGPG